VHLAVSVHALRERRWGVSHTLHYLSGRVLYPADISGIQPRAVLEVTATGDVP
jgi:hypothetical protein